MLLTHSRSQTSTMRGFAAKLGVFQRSSRLLYATKEDGNMFSKRWVIRILTALIFVGTLGVLTASASTYTTGPLVLASGPSPFATCTVGASGTPGETVYVNAEVEPWVA